MRTTIDLNDEVLRRAKKRAADEGIPLRALIEDALRAHLATGSRRSGYKLLWRTEHGRLLPGIDLDDRAALLGRMDGR